MKYAVIVLSGKQYKIHENEEILVDKLSAKSGDRVTFDEVLLFRAEDKVLIGNPYITSASIVGKVLGEEKGEKINIIKFKAKAHYRRKIGFRPKYTKILIEKINFREIETVKKRHPPAKT